MCHSERSLASAGLSLREPSGGICSAAVQVAKRKRLGTGAHTKYALDFHFIFAYSCSARFLTRLAATATSSLKISDLHLSCLRSLEYRAAKREMDLRSMGEHDERDERRRTCVNP